MSNGSNVISNYDLIGSTDPVRDILRRTEERLGNLERTYRGVARVGPGVLAVEAVSELAAMSVPVGTRVYVLATDETYTMQPDATTFSIPVPGFPSS